MAFGQKMRSNLQRHRVWKVSILQLFEMFVSLSKIQHDIYEDPITLADPEFGVIADLCWSPDVSQWSIYFCSVAFELWHPFIFHSKLLSGGGGGRGLKAILTTQTRRIQTDTDTHTARIPQPFSRYIWFWADSKYLVKRRPFNVKIVRKKLFKMFTGHLWKNWNCIANS